jgi:hypothetical protein
VGDQLKHGTATALGLIVAVTKVTIRRAGGGRSS